MVGRIAAAYPGVTVVGVAGPDPIPAMRQFVDKYKLQGFGELADADGAVWSLVHEFSTLWFNDAINPRVKSADPMATVERIAAMLFGG